MQLETLVAIPLNEKKIRQACLLHWQGDLLKDIAILMDINPNTLTRWRKTDIWINYEAKLIEEWHQQQHAGGRPSEE